MPSIQTDIDACRNEYIRQRRLEEFVTKRELNRPDTQKWQVVLLFSVLPLPLFCSLLILFLWRTAVILKIFVFLLLILSTFELYVRFCLLQAVQCYQHYAKEETRRRCMCVPSCSEYAIICLKKIFPLAVALIKIRIRLYRTCKGDDYKLDFPIKKMNAEFEQKYFS